MDDDIDERLPARFKKIVDHEELGHAAEGSSKTEAPVCLGKL
jgi:hypothetical protein